MEQQEIVMEQHDVVEAEVELEFIGTLEDVTRGWTGPTDDFIDGDWTP
ncbi:hypothetical protein [Sorangium sp. So ce1099]